MAGTLTISTLSDGTNSTSATNCIQGSAKAWVQFNGSTATIKTAYNVSSITRTSTGTYTVTLTNALADANYAAVCQCGNIGSLRLTAAPDTTAPTSSVYKMVLLNSGYSQADAEYCSVVFFR